jgi:hypothetical protein
MLRGRLVGRGSSRQVGVTLPHTCTYRPFEHPLSQFPLLPYEILQKLTTRNTPLDRMRDMDAEEIGATQGERGSVT